MLARNDESTTLCGGDIALQAALGSDVQEILTIMWSRSRDPHSTTWHLRSADFVALGTCSRAGAKMCSFLPKVCFFLPGLLGWRT